MPTYLTFQNVSLYKKHEYGIADVNFTFKQGGKYHFILNTDEQITTLSGLIDGRFQKDSGYINRKDKLFVQNDRLLMGDKTYIKNVDRWLALDREFFMFGKKKRSKRGIMELIKARHIRYLPIYKLKDEDKLKFTLLSLAFQESGIIIISRLLTLQLSEILQTFLDRLLNETHCICCLISSLESPILTQYKNLQGYEHLDLTKSRK